MGGVRVDDKAFFFFFNIGLRRHQIPPLVYSCSRPGFHYTWSSPPSRPNKRRIHYDTTVGAACVSMSYYLIILNQWLLKRGELPTASASSMPHKWD